MSDIKQPIFHYTKNDVQKQSQYQKIDLRGLHPEKGNVEMLLFEPTIEIFHASQYS